jgi:hypothetical protein
MTNYLGIDPGLSGGFVNIVDNQICWKLAMPTIEVTTEMDGSKTEIDRDAIYSYLSIFPTDTYAVIEKQHPVRNQDIERTCTTCKNYGIILMALRKIHTIEVSAHEWQSYFGIVPVTQQSEGKTTKEQALCIAQALYPDVDFRKSGRARKAHDGIVDAALIATYCVAVSKVFKTLSSIVNAGVDGLVKPLGATRKQKVGHGVGKDRRKNRVNEEER